MTTYQVFKDNDLIKGNASITEAYHHVPAGSKLISGTTCKSIVKPEGGLEEVIEVKAVFKIRSGGHVTIIQNSK